MDRRLFLKGALLASATPAAALAPQDPSNDLSALLAQHSTLEALFNTSDTKQGEISQRGDRPPFPHIVPSEFGPFYCGFPTRELFSIKDINALFDRERQQVGWGCFTPMERDRRYKLVSGRRRAAIQAFREREAAYAAWQQRSGYAAQDVETRRLAKLLGDVEDRIMEFRCSTIEEVRLKAAFFDRVYGSSAPENFIETFVRSLIS
jgi:hypothetical protein